MLSRQAIDVEVDRREQVIALGPAQFSWAVLLQHQRQSLESTADGRDFEQAGHHTFCIEYGSDVQALQAAAPRNGLGQFINRDAGFVTTYVGLTQHELVDWDIPGSGEGDFLDDFRHLFFSTTGVVSHSPGRPLHSRSLGLSDCRMSTAVDVMLVYLLCLLAFEVRGMG